MKTLTQRALQQKNTKLNIMNLTAFAKIAVWCGIYRLLLDILYVNFIAVRWAYYGFTFEIPSFLSYVGSWCLTLIVATCLTQLMKLQMFSSIVLQCLLILAFLPGVVLYTFMNEATAMYSYYLLYWLALIVFFFVICNRTVKPIQFAVSEKTLSQISVIFFLICLFVWSIYARFHLQLDLIEVYDQRSVASRFNMPLPIVYLFAGAQVCLPFLAVWALTKKKRVIFFVNVAAQILAFFAVGTKSAFFALTVGVISYFYIEKRNIDYTTAILQGISLVSVGCFLEIDFTGTYFILDFIIRRMIFLPNLLNIYYFDFFSLNEFDYFRSSILRFLTTDSLYNDKIQMIIGGIYFNRPNMYANNGLFSDAYMNLGYIGLVVMPILIVLLLRLFDICIGKTNVSLMISSMVYLVFCLTGSSFFTNLFSHGFLLLAFLFCFMDKKDAIIIKLGK